MAKLTSAQRKNLPASDFVYPSQRAYPIPDEAHARDALARAAQSHNEAVIQHVDAAVKKRFPNIEVNSSHG
jgi:hypothetical protein